MPDGVKVSSYYTNARGTWTGCTACLGTGFSVDENYYPQRRRRPIHCALCKKPTIADQCVCPECVSVYNVGKKKLAFEETQTDKAYYAFPRDTFGRWFGYVVKQHPQVTDELYREFKERFGQHSSGVDFGVIFGGLANAEVITRWDDGRFAEGIPCYILNEKTWQFEEKTSVIYVSQYSTILMNETQAQTARWLYILYKKTVYEVEGNAISDGQRVLMQLAEGGLSAKDLAPLSIRKMEGKDEKR